MLPGGHSWEFFVGVYNPALQNMILSQTKICHFRTRFQTWPLKFIPVFRLRFELVRSTCGIFLFLPYSFGIETINTFMHSRSSLENHTRFQTKMDKVYTRFQTFGAAHTYMACTREYTPPGKKLYPSMIPSVQRTQILHQTWICIIFSTLVSFRIVTKRWYLTWLKIASLRCL